MGVVVALGESKRVQGFALVGVTVAAADDAAAVCAAWRALPEAAELVILTAAAQAALHAGGLIDEAAPLTVVMSG